MFNRRSLLLVLLTMTASGCVRSRRRRRRNYRQRHALGPRRRQRRRMYRRRRRRRIHRRMAWRSVGGRRIAVVPVGVVVGWELTMTDRVVVVEDVKIVQVNGQPQEYLVVAAADGSREEIPIIRENTAENSEELTGSELSVEDDETPGIEID